MFHKISIVLLFTCMSTTHAMHSLITKAHGPLRTVSQRARYVFQMPSFEDEKKQLDEQEKMFQNMRELEERKNKIAGHGTDICTCRAIQISTVSLLAATGMQDAFPVFMTGALIGLAQTIIKSSKKEIASEKKLIETLEKQLRTRQ